VPVQFEPIRGGPAEVSTLPSLPITRAPSALTMPVADLTPGTAATRVTVAAGSGAATSSPSISDIAILGFALTATSVSE
jgi:hypothetical protein